MVSAVAGVIGAICPLVGALTKLSEEEKSLLSPKCTDYTKNGELIVRWKKWSYLIAIKIGTTMVVGTIIRRHIPQAWPGFVHIIKRSVGGGRR